MNKHLRLFLHRGLIFGGFGPIIIGIVFMFIELGGTQLSLGGGEVLLAIFSTYVLAFVQAGASVFNQMGTMFGNGIVGTIVFIIVFIVGHVFNLALNLLGTYVHTCRLQYIEFFGKFYEGGGRAFHPFRSNTKYVDIKEEI